MAFAEDLAQFFDVDDFAVVATFTRAAAAIATVNAIFDRPTQEVGIYEQQVEELAPRVRARTAQVTSVRRGDACTVSAVAYRVERIVADGTGVSTIFLAQQS